MKRLEGLVCVITGAAQGIGRATAVAMALEGAKVMATDRNKAALSGLSGMKTAQLDVSDASAVTTFAAQTGRVDVLVNCAGFVATGNILDSDEHDWDTSFNINAKAAWRLIRSFLPGMIEGGGGSIINVASVVSSVVAAPQRCVYAASKAALIGLTKSVAADFVGHGIRSNAICPGTVESPSLEQRLHATGDYTAARAAFTARQPMKRIAQPQEIAALAVYLASRESAFVTGVAHVIDGGWANI